MLKRRVKIVVAQTDQKLEDKLNELLAQADDNATVTFVIDYVETPQPEYKAFVTVLEYEPEYEYDFEGYCDDCDEDLFGDEAEDEDGLLEAKPVDFVVDPGFSAEEVVPLSEQGQANVTPAEIDLTVVSFKKSKKNLPAVADAADYQVA